MELRSDRRYPMPAETAAVWAAIGSVDQYRQWWPWLRQFEAEGLVEGDVWVCAIQPPLPYSLRFTVRIDHLEVPGTIEVTIDGDVTGTARVELVPSAEGSEIHLVASLSPSRRWLQAVSILARPLARFGHDWILDTGARQFAERAL